MVTNPTLFKQNTPVTTSYDERSAAPGRRDGATTRTAWQAGSKSEYDALLSYAYFVLDQQAKYCQE